MALKPYDIDSILNGPATPRPSTSPYPPLPPEEEQNLLSRIGGGLLSGVGALGNFLDSTFGGRAVRGLLGGHPRELLSPLPFSDTLGITDPNEKTSGRQLLQNAGLVGEPEPGLEWGDLAGFGTEVALNPLTYFSPFGAHTAAGRLWAKTSPGTMPKTLGAQVRGADYAAEQVAKLPPVAAGALPPGLAIPAKASMIPEEVSQAARAQGLELLPRQTRIALHESDTPPTIGSPPGGGPIPALPHPASYDQAIEGLGQGQYPRAGNYVGNANTKTFRTLDVEPPTGGLPPVVSGARHALLDAEGGGQGTPLASAFGFKLPFGPQLNFGTGSWGQAYADKLSGINQWVHGLPGMAALGKRLNPANVDRATAEGQDLAQGTYRPVQAQVMQGVRGATYDFQHELAEPLRSLPAYEGQRLATLAAENRLGPMTGAEYAADLYTRDPELWARMDAQGQFPIPDEVFPALQAAGQKMGAYARGTLAPEAELGMPAVPQPDYFPRQLVKLEGRAHAAGPGGGRGLSGRHASQIARQDLWEEFPGGQTQINDLFRTRALQQNPVTGAMEAQPVYTGPARTATDLATEDKVLELVHGHSVRSLLNPGQIKHAQEVSELLKGSDPRRAVAGYFDVNPVLGAGNRGTRGALGQAGAETMLEAVRQYGKPIAELGDQNVEPITSFLRRGGLTGKGLGGTGEEVAPGLAAQRLGLEGTEGLSNYGLPQHIADDLMDLSRPGKSSQNYYDKALNLYRSWLYGAWPAAQARNRVWGAVSNWLQGAGPLEQLRARNDMSKLLRGTGEVEPLPNLEGFTPGMSQPEVQNLIKREMFSHNAALTQATHSRYQLETSPSVSDLDRLAQRLPPETTGGSELDAVKSFFTGLKPQEGQSAWQAINPANVPGVVEDVGPGGGNVWLNQMRRVGGLTEDMNRGTLYLPLRRQGYSPEAAAQVSNQTHHLYNDLTNWERDVGRRLALFPTFSLRNLPMLGRVFAKDPSKLNALIQASSGGLRSPGDFVPPYLAESTAVPLGGAEDGQQKYLSGFGFGYEDEGVRALGSLLGGHPGRAAGNVLGQLSPALKYPLELATGQQLHTGRQLEDLRPGPTATGLAGLFNEDKAGAVAQIAANSPLSRAVTTLDQLVDERKGLLPKASNLLTGLKFTDVDLARQKEIAARHLVEESLRGKPGFGNYERLYVRPEKVGNLSPDEFQLMSLYTQLEKQAVAAAKARKATQGPPPGIGGP